MRNFVKGSLLKVLVSFIVLAILISAFPFSVFATTLTCSDINPVGGDVFITGIKVNSGYEEVKFNESGTETLVQCMKGDTLSLNMYLDGKVNKFSIEFNGTVCEWLNTYKVKNLRIKSNLVGITIPVSMIRKEADSIVINARVLDDKELTDAQKKSINVNRYFTGIGATGTVYDISLYIDNKQVTQLTQPIKVDIPYYSLEPKGNAEELTAYSLSDDGKAENMHGLYETEMTRMSFTTWNLGKYFAKPDPISFKDLKGYESYKKYITAMTSKGIFTRSSDGKFLPGKTITRAELAEMLVNIFKIREDKNIEKKSFSDVKQTDWFYNSVTLATQNGLISGNGDKFSPNGEVTNQEAASIFAKAAEKYKGKNIKVADKLVKCSDKSKIAANAKVSVNYVVATGIMSLNSSKAFQPSKKMSRAEAAKAIYMLFSLK